jgi:two-component system nitrate/nitrite response regulator NarL
MGKKADNIRVLIFSARSLVRRGIISALDDEDGIEVLGQASNRLELMEGIGSLNPDIIIVNDDYRGRNVLEIIQLMIQKVPNTKILLLIKDYDEDKELEALKLGVRGFLPESAAKADFIKCVKAVNKGEMWIRRKVMEKLIQQLLVPNVPKGVSELSPHSSFIQKGKKRSSS